MNDRLRMQILRRLIVMGLIGSDGEDYAAFAAFAGYPSTL